MNKRVMLNYGDAPGIRISLFFNAFRIKKAHVKHDLVINNVFNEIGITDFILFFC